MIDDYYDGYDAGYADLVPQSDGPNYMRGYTNGKCDRDLDKDEFEGD